MTAPLALLVEEPRAKTRGRAAGLLALAASTAAAILASGPGVCVLGWLGGAWSLFVLLGEADAETQGARAHGPFVLHTLAAASVLAASLSPALLPLLILAGAIRLGIPPFHGALARAYEILPTGAVLLLAVGFAATGLAAVSDGLAALALKTGAATVAVGTFAAFGAAWAGLNALPQADLRRRLAGFLSAQGALWCAMLALLDPALARPAVGGWALVTFVATVAVIVGYARRCAFTRTGVLRAYGGLGRTALVRATLLLVTLSALLGAPFLGARGRGALALVALVRAAPLAGLAAAFGGALGCLALGLAIYRTIRGEAPAPIPAPDLAGREWAFLAVFALTLVFGLPPLALWHLPVPGEPQALAAMRQQLVGTDEQVAELGRILFGAAAIGVAVHAVGHPAARPGSTRPARSPTTAGRARVARRCCWSPGSRRSGSCARRGCAAWPRCSRCSARARASCSRPGRSSCRPCGAAPRWRRRSRRWRSCSPTRAAAPPVTR